MKSAILFAGILLLFFPSDSFTQEQKPALVLKTRGDIPWIAFSPDGKSLLSASKFPDRAGGEDHELQLWDATNGKLIAGPVKSDYISASGTISSDGKLAVTGSFSGGWQLWSLPDLKPLHKGEWYQGRVDRIAFSPDGGTFTALRADFRKRFTDPFKASRVTYIAQTVDTRTGKMVGEPQLWPRELWKKEHSSTPRISEPAGWSKGMSPAFGNDGRAVLPTAAETIALEVPDDSENCGGPTACAISPNRKLAVSSGCNGTVIIWDYANGKPIGKPLTKAENLQIMEDALLFSPNSDRIAVVRMVRFSNPEHFRPIITVYDVETRNTVGVPIQPGRTSLLSAMAFSPDGETLAIAFLRIGHGEKEIQLWKVTAAK